MNKPLQVIFNFICKHRSITYICCIILCGLFLTKALNITPKNDLLDLLPKNDPTINQYQTTLRHFNPMELTYFDIHTNNNKDLNKVIQTADLLATRLEASKLFSKITYKVTEGDIQKFLDVLRSHYPIYFSKDLEKDFKNKFKEKEIIRSINHWKEILYESPIPSLNKIFTQDPLGIDVSLYNLAKSAYSEGDDISIKNSRIQSKDHKHAFIIASPKFPASNSTYAKEVVNFIDQSIADLKSTGIDIAYISSHRFALLNETIMKHDIKQASTLSILGIFILCFLCFRKRFLPVFLLLPMGFGLLVSIGILTFLPYDISLITIGCGSILLGIVIDYGIHIIYSVDQQGDYKKESIHNIVQTLLKPLTISALTTALAFSCLYLSNFNSYQQFAIFASLGVMCSYLFTVTVFPTFFIGLKPTKNKPILSFEKLYSSCFRLILSYKKTTLIFVLILSILAVFGATKIKYQQDLRKLYATNKQTQEDQELISSSFKSASTSTSLIINTLTLEDALQKNSRLYKELLELQQQGIIESIKSIAPLLPSESTQLDNLKRWNQLVLKDGNKFIHTFEDAISKLKLEKSAFKPFTSRIRPSKQLLSLADFKNTSIEELTEKQVKMTNQGSFILTNVKLSKDVTFTSLKDILNKKMPDVIAVNSAYFLSYVMDLIPSELLYLSMIGLISVGILLLVTCGPINVIQLLTPILISILWTLGFMGWVGIKFNIMNCVIILFMFGLISDYSVFLTEAFKKPAKAQLTSITTSCGAITISVLTTIIGIGALSLSKHPIFQSVGLTTLVGMVSGYLAVIIVVPLLARPKT